MSLSWNSRIIADPVLARVHGFKVAGSFGLRLGLEFVVPAWDVNQFGEPGCRTVSIDLKLPTYAARISSAGKKLWPERDGVRAVSPYSARHQVKADMKARGLSDVEIAAAMGHSTTKSQRYYGGSGKASGSVAPTKIEAARKVKVKPGYFAKNGSKPAPTPASAKRADTSVAAAVRRKMRP